MTSPRQFLTDSDRDRIRADVYRSKKYKAENDEKIKFFKKYCADKKVLDLGCVDHNPLNEESPLWLHGQLKKVAASILGVDYYKDGVTALNEKGYNIFCADAQNFEFEQNFDVVSAGDLIEHVANPGMMFSCVNKHLEINGKFLISTPNPWCWKYAAYFWVFKKMNKINQEHVAWYCPETLKLIGARYGFKVIEIKLCSRRLWEKILPLPTTMRATTINLAYVKISNL